MQVFHVSPPSSVELAPAGSAPAAPDAADGFSQVLARQQSGQSAGAEPPAQPSGTSSPSSSADGGGVASDAGADAAAVDTGTEGPAQASGSALASPLADMVRELTARSRAVAADSLERSLAAQAAGKGSDLPASGRPGRTGRVASDDSEAGDTALELDPALAQLDADGTRKTTTRRGDAQGDSPPSIEHATALATPDINARASSPALRPANAATPVAHVAAGIHLPGQAASGASPAHTQAGSSRDLKPDLMADARQGRDPGPMADRGDAMVSADALAAGGKTLVAQAADPLFAGMLPSSQPGDALAALNPVSMMPPAVAAMPQAMAPVAPTLTGSIPAPVGSPQWAPAFSEQMVQIGTQQGGTLHHAELRLDPPDLGPLRVTLSMQGDQATATFVSPHASVRTAVEAALPQLMQALADAGISLGNTSVGEQDAREFAAEDARRGAGPDTGEADDGSAVAQAVVQTRPRGLIDTFA